MNSANATYQAGDLKQSLGNTSGAIGGPGATLSTLANYPKAKINKLI
jgi:hypothetical protein